MDFAYSPKIVQQQRQLSDFLDRYIVPHGGQRQQEVTGGVYPPALLDELKPLAKLEGLWNLFLPALTSEQSRTCLTNLKYAPLPVDLKVRHAKIGQTFYRKPVTSKPHRAHVVYAYLLSGLSR